VPRKKQSFFDDLTPEEVAAVESSTFVIQVGSDLYCHDGHFTFTRRGAIYHYNKIRTELVHLLSDGDKKERQHARRCLENLRVLPLRIH